MSSESQLTFFRQSGWMVMAITASGVFMWAVHVPASRMPPAEYAVFATLLQVLTLMLVPGLSLQTVITQQTAAARTEDQRQGLAGTVHTLLRWLFVFWLLLACASLAFQDSVTATLKISNPAALWITILACLPTLLLPVAQGLLQGCQNFLWLGWIAILAGFGRFLTVLVTVVWLGGHAAGGMIGPLLGMGSAFAMGLWHTRALWQGPSVPLEWKPWLKQIIPLTLGLATGQIMFAADMIVVQSFFRSDTGLYALAGAVARGIVLFAGPVALVMFPKIVRSTTQAESRGLLGQALLATGVLAGSAALGCTLLPELPFLVMNRAYLPIAPLLPWFAWCMAPLAIANVLINHLLARSQFKAVPWLLAVAVVYVVVLMEVARAVGNGSSLREFKFVVLTLGGFNLLLLGVAAWFTWRPSRATGPATEIQ